MLTLFHAPRSRSSRIVWLLEDLGAPYEIRYTGIVYGDGTGRRDPDNVHPDGKVPALVDDGRLVTESAAIALYLCERHPEAGLAPAIDASDRAAFLTWLVWTECEFGPALIAATFGGADQSPRAKANHAAALARIFTALDRGPYLMGDRFTAADIMAGAGLLWARSHLPTSQALDRYLERITARPAFGRAQAKDAPMTAGNGGEQSRPTP